MFIYIHTDRHTHRHACMHVQRELKIKKNRDQKDDVVTVSKTVMEMEKRCLTRCMF